MQKTEIYTRIKELKVVPVIVIDELDSALPLADALIAGGMSIVEITFRTDAAADAINKELVPSSAFHKTDKTNAGKSR